MFELLIAGLAYLFIKNEEKKAEEHYSKKGKRD